MTSTVGCGPIVQHDGLDASVTSYKGAPLDEGDDTLIPRLFYTDASAFSLYEAFVHKADCNHRHLLRLT